MKKKYITLYFLFTLFCTNCLNAQTADIPDENFEQALIDLGLDDDLDGVVKTSNINAISSLDVSSKNINNLRGIEYFLGLKILDCSSNKLDNLNFTSNMNLVSLDCSSNKLTSLNLSNNSGITTLDCSGNDLTSLDLNNKTSLTTLNCSGNELTSLDLSKNSALSLFVCNNGSLTNLDLTNNTVLTSIECNNNNLTNLDLGNNTVLTSLQCYNNFLINLDVSNSTALTSLDCKNNNIASLEVTNNIALTSLNCSSNSISSLNITNSTALTSLNCGTNNLIGLDVTENIALRGLNCKKNKLASLDVTKNIALTDLTCEKNNIASLDLTNNTFLEGLFCGANNLTSLNLNNNTNLYAIFCADNDLTSLDVSNNTQIFDLWCENNNIASLNLINNPDLEDLSCANNNLGKLNLKNRVNGLRLKAKENPKLTCIQVDEAAFSTANWTNIDPQTSFSENCYTTVYNVDFQNNNNEIKIDSLSVAADGSRATLFKYTGTDYENVAFQIKEAVIGEDDLYGRFEIGLVVNDTLNVIYHHPEYFPYENQKNKEVTIEIIDTETDNLLEEYPINIVRPLVLMVHGIWSGGHDAFFEMEKYLLDSNMYNPFQIDKMYYLNDMSNSGFNARIYKTSKNKLIANAIGNNVSNSKIDVIGHSNGGLLSRQYIQSSDYQNDINKLITLNTPHLGSQMANLLLSNKLKFSHPIMRLLGYDPNNGIIEDLTVDSEFISELNDFPLDTYRDIGIHSIYTNELISREVNADTWVGLITSYLTYSPGINILDNYLEEDVFNSPFHDIVVSQLSQIGGSEAITFVDNQWHINSAKNPTIKEKVKGLLNENINDEEHFSLDGYNPVILEPPTNTNKATSQFKSNELITLINPIAGTQFKAGQIVSIEANGSSGIINIVSSMGNATIPLKNHVTENASSSNFSLTIPNDALGRLEIVSAGFSVNGFEDYDSTFIIVTTDAVLESIEINQSAIFVLMGGQSVITVLGNYDDGEVRNITNIDDIIYGFAEGNAEITESGLVNGLSEGEDVLTVSYLGKSATVPITVANSITLNIDENILNNDGFVVFPNPVDDILTIKSPLNLSMANAKLYNVLGQQVLNKKMINTNNELNLVNLHNGLYLLKLETENGTISKRIIKK